MTVDTHAGKPSYDYAGQTYHFCSEGCRTKFAAEPARYLDQSAAPKPLPLGTLYTCPMHPEIVQEGPGACPICGMALEPMGVPPEHEQAEPRAHRLHAAARGRRAAVAVRSSPWT